MATTLADRISEAFERDQRETPVARTADDVPISYEAMTPEWLTAVLCAKHPGAKILDFTMSARDDGSSNRRRLFLTYNEAGIAAGLPASVFCKGAHALVNRYNLALTGAGHGEMVFYTRVRDRLTIEAPRAYHTKYDPRYFTHIVILEDMAGAVEFGSHRTIMNRTRAESMVRLMANYHARMFEDPDLISGRLTLPTWQAFWDNLIVSVDMRGTCEAGFRNAETVIPARLYARADEIWPRTMEAMAIHGRLRHTLLHGDTHLGNWYVRPGDVMGLMDWQCLAVGNWSRDFAYAVSCALDPEDRRAWERDLLRLYVEEVRALGGETINPDAAYDLYRLQLMTALGYWTNTLCPSEIQPQDMQPQDTALEFIRRMATAVDDLDVLDMPV